METYKEKLIDYLLVKKNKKRDFITYTTYLNVRLTALLQNLKGEIECFQDFVVDMRRKRFNENSTFPNTAAEFTIIYGRELVHFNFQWVIDEAGTGLYLKCLVNNKIHQQFDSELLECFDTPPQWLTNCKYCNYEHNLGNAEEFAEDKIAEFIVDTFRMMTQNFLI